ncbi:hypothetical protein [Streptosporangium sp. NPDC006007]|uniref:hypothetical protein n=1 Tax=Streptosporangium sp. NPDC006007 TaxID=3154575 RepID=UPI0033B94527
MAPQWPATITDREVVSVNRTDRSDGYDWIAHLRFTYSNGVVGNWNLSGGISHRGRFTEWLTTFSVDNVPPTTPPDRLVREMRVKIDYGEEGDPEELRAAGTRSVLLDQATTYADGHTDVTTGQPLLVQKTLRDLSIEETIAQISHLIEKAGSRPQQ